MEAGYLYLGFSWKSICSGAPIDLLSIETSGQVLYLGIVLNTDMIPSQILLSAYDLIKICDLYFECTSPILFKGGIKSISNSDRLSVQQH